MAYGALAAIPKAEIIHRIRNGEQPVDIAASLGIDKSAISHYYSKDPEYLKAREQGMEIRLDEGLRAIEDAGDDLHLARAREIVLRRREWRAEKEFERWRTKSHVTMDVSIDLGEKLRRSKERVINPVDPQSIELTAQHIDSKDESDGG